MTKEARILLLSFAAGITLTMFGRLIYRLVHDLPSTPGVYAVAVAVLGILWIVLSPAKEG